MGRLSSMDLPRYMTYERSNVPPSRKLKYQPCAMAASVFLWKRDVTGFGLIVIDHYSIFFNFTLCGIGLLTILLSSEGKTSIPWLFGISVDGIRLLAFATSLGVAASAGIEEVMKFGERWRHYRRTAELLKTLGWQYLMLNGQFRRYHSHADACASFTERVEDTLNEDVEGYLSAMSGEGGERSTRHEVVA